MLPVYRAISFHGIYSKRNRTKPWLVSVNADGHVKQFVVKMFENSSIEIHDSVTNEVIGNVLAQEFDLPVPNAALIDIGEDFISTLRDFDALEVLENADRRLKFGTEEQRGVIPFDTSLTCYEAKQIIEIDNVFGFDCLIRNIDRNRGNPNLLIRNSDAFLIDHELAFQIDNKSRDEIVENWFLADKYFRYHIFFDYLKNSYKSDKQDYFNTFDEYLRTLNINKLKPYFEQLKDAGFPEKNHNLIEHYIGELKHNSSIFVKILKGIINGRPIHI